MNVPNHIAIIMDGNRRFSQRMMQEPWKGHEYGVKQLEKLYDWCKEMGLKKVTLYAFSLDNFNRPKKEFDFLMKIFNEAFDRLKDDKRIDTEGVRINVIGRLELFPKDVQERMRWVNERTKNNKDYTFNICMAYGGRAELVDAAKKLALKVKNNQMDIDEINEESFTRELYIEDEPDLIIRTGGEKRLSNFLPWQSIYSELFFVDKLWPEFEKEDLMKILEEFSQRQRRFGR